MSPRDRWNLGTMMGKLGDTRVVSDMRDRDAHVEIKAGDYRVGPQNRRHRVKMPFLISRYLVTVSQYQRFMDEDGYGDGLGAVSRWWSSEGQRWLRQADVNEP